MDQNFNLGPSFPKIGNFWTLKLEFDDLNQKCNQLRFKIL